MVTQRRVSMIPLCRDFRGEGSALPVVRQHIQQPREYARGHGNGARQPRETPGASACSIRLLVIEPGDGAAGGDEAGAVLGVGFAGGDGLGEAGAGV